jgi:hypothetical protein
VNQGKGNEVPVAENNHALDALRYLISRIDQRGLGRSSVPYHPPKPDGQSSAAPTPAKQSKFWELAKNEDLWTKL